MASMSQSQAAVLEAGHLDWNTVRPLFTRLYLVERKTLVAIRQIMSCQHGFNASVNQYKKKIRQWKLEKNVKAKEKRDMIAQLKSNGVTPRSDQDYQLSGKTIHGRKLSRYEKNQGKACYAAYNDSRTNQTTSCGPSSPAVEPYCQSRERDTPATRSGVTSSKVEEIRLDGRLDRVNELATWLVSWLWLREWNGLMFDEMDFVGKIGLWSGNLRPSDRFLKWTTELLSKIPVGQDAVLLALLYVYRLKFRNPLVVGDPGSEYKLLIVALILANKHSGTNLYPLQVWSSTTLIPAAELETLQEEFLKRMGYSPLVQPDVWASWFEKMKGLSRAMAQVFGDLKTTDRSHEAQAVNQNAHPIQSSAEVSSRNEDAISDSATGSRATEEEDVERQPQEARFWQSETHRPGSPRRPASPRTETDDTDTPSDDANTRSTLLGQYGWLQFYDHSLDPYYQIDEAQGLQETLFSTPTDEKSPSLSPQFPRLFSPAPSQKGSIFMNPDSARESSGTLLDFEQ